MDIEDNLIDFRIQLGRTLRRVFHSTELELGPGDSEVLSIAVVDEATVTVQPIAAVQPKVDQSYQLTSLDG